MFLIEIFKFIGITVGYTNIICINVKTGFIDSYSICSLKVIVYD